MYCIAADWNLILPYKNIEAAGKIKPNIEALKGGTVIF